MATCGMSPILFMVNRIISDIFSVINPNIFARNSKLPVVMPVKKLNSIKGGIKGTTTVFTNIPSIDMMPIL